MPRPFTTKSRPANPLSLPPLCGLWAWSWTCADRGKLRRADDVLRVRGYHKETGQLNMSPGSLLLPSQTDPVSLKLIISPSQTALLQFSFSRLFYICLLLCAWALADAQLNSGRKTVSQIGCQSVFNDAPNEVLWTQVSWTWCMDFCSSSEKCYIISRDCICRVSCLNTLTDDVRFYS